MGDIPEAMRRQIDRNEAANLLCSHVEDIIELEPDFLAALEELLRTEDRSRPDFDIDALVANTAKALLQKIWSVNQFIHITEADRERLEAIYANTWKRLHATGDLPCCLRRYHYPALKRWLGRLYPESFRVALRSSRSIGRVVCEEYPVELQVELLGIECRGLPGPILDIGCGRHGRLVLHMRSLGIEAYGVDRDIGLESAYLMEEDWLSFGFDREKWGTVIANMSFTNHCIYALRYDEALARLYRKTYGEIARSLKLAGTFIYAPGLPTLERDLDPLQFTVESREGFRDYMVTKLKRIGRVGAG